MAPTSASSTSPEEEFLYITTENPWRHRSETRHNEPEDFYSKWVGQMSAPNSLPPVFGAHVLKRLYPNHSLVISEDYTLNILGFPNAQITPLEKSSLITNSFFIPVSRKLGIPGVLIDKVQFGVFKISWQQYHFIVHAVTYPAGSVTRDLRFILHEGPEEVSRRFLLSVGAWANTPDNEIWVFDRGFWSKSHALWTEIQKADWKDVILKDEFKKTLQKDIYGFFDSEDIYKELAIPWKRGIIMHGPPGNGKTISLKAIMKSCGEKDFLPLYVKSFKSWAGEEAAMAEVFNKARQLSPCVLVLEDLDSLVDDVNRSFFLNQLDGLEGNDGLLVIGTTNHFDKLDPGISTRPSRFDRKYLFDNPDEVGRKLYAQYWQKKLSLNKEIHFPDGLVEEFVFMTARFSFAYLKEAFVSSLVILAGFKDEKPTFESVLKGQVAELRKQLGNAALTSQKLSSAVADGQWTPLSNMKGGQSTPPARMQESGAPSGLSQIVAFFRPLSIPPSQSVANTPPLIRLSEELQDTNNGERNFRELIDRLASSGSDAASLSTEGRQVYAPPNVFASNDFASQLKPRPSSFAHNKGFD